MFASQTKRPRNVTSTQAAAILYGDWGTSKAYVLGLAFALAGYSSFWLILMVSILTVLVGVNYILICKFYPNGGGVYASVRDRSEVLALLGAYFLIADYLVTAALSALSAFNYIGVPEPALWAAASILFVGALNYFGPRHTGNIAFFIVVPTVITVFALAFFSIPHLDEAVRNLRPLKGNIVTSWVEFVGVIVALSGIEAIANTTGVMRLDPGSKDSRPSVVKTSTPAILYVMIEVCVFTTLFALAMQAIPDMKNINGDVIASNQENVRDYMLRYMAETFGGNVFGPEFGHIFGVVISIIFCILLLSAVNTAIIALVSLLFVMSRDREVPRSFEKLNSYGVPIYPLLAAAFLPFILVATIADVAGLADLYAVGFVGAIATNLGSTATNLKLSMKGYERYLMIGTFLVMLAIELTLLITKPGARNFAIFIFAAGLFLRALVMEGRAKAAVKKALPAKPYTISDDINPLPLHTGSMLCAINHRGKTLEYALEECQSHQQNLYILFVREQQTITEEDRVRTWLDDKGACQLFDYAKDKLDKVSIRFIYIVSDSTADSIVDTAKNLNVSRVILGFPRKNKLFLLLKGNVVREVAKTLPHDIDLIIVS